MPLHLMLLIASFLLLMIAGIMSWPHPTAPAWLGTALGWFGLAAYVLAALVP